MTVTVYTLPACVQCDRTKKMLDKKFINYSEIDISLDSVAYDTVKTLGYTAAPVVVAGDEHWSGFRPDLIDGIES